MSHGLLMDTHIWLWFALRNPRLRPPARKAIDRAVNTGELQVSIMSVWEISLLEAKGHIRLGMHIADWMAHALALPGLEVLPLEPALIFDAHRLPGQLHADPADRLLVATARHCDLIFITEDRKILDYARQGYLRACSSGNEELLES